MRYLKIPIIPVAKIVFFPGSSLPIYIVEKIYQKMVLDCLESETPIGICLADEHYSTKHSKTYLSPRELGTYGKFKLTSVNKEQMAIEIKGEAKIRLRNLVRQVPYLVYEVELVADPVDEEQMRKSPEVRSLSQLLLDWIKINIPHEEDKDKFFANLTSISSIINHVAMYLVEDPELQQIILECDLLRERVMLLCSLINKQKFTENRHIGSIIKDFEYNDTPLALSN